MPPPMDWTRPDAHSAWGHLLCQSEPCPRPRQAGQRPVLVLSIDAINRLPLVVTVVVGTKGENITRDYPTNVALARRKRLADGNGLSGLSSPFVRPAAFFESSCRARHRCGAQENLRKPCGTAWDSEGAAGGGAGRGGGAKRRCTCPHRTELGTEPTPYSVRCAAAFRRGSPRALGSTKMNDQGNRMIITGSGHHGNTEVL